MPSLSTQEAITNPIPNRPEAKLPSLRKGSSISFFSRPQSIHVSGAPCLSGDLKFHAWWWPRCGRTDYANRFVPRTSGSRVRKRPLSLPNNLPKEVRKGDKDSTETPTSGPRGWARGARASYTKTIRVTSTAPVASILRRVREALERGPERTRGLSLSARVNQANAEYRTRNQERQTSGAIGDRFDDVVLVGTGRAIQKTMEAGAVFSQRKDLLVTPRTFTVQGIDDIINDDDAADVEDTSRVRNISGLEIGIRWATK